MPLTGTLHHDRLMHQRYVRLTAEHLGGKLSGAYFAPVQINDVDRRHVLSLL